MDILKSLFKELSGYKGIEEALKKNISPVSVTGLSHIHRVCGVTASKVNQIHIWRKK